MKVILLEDVENLGESGEIVTVKPGYGRNHLIPQGAARLATPGAIRHAEELTRQAAHKIAQKKEDAEELAAAIEKEPILVMAKVGEDSKLFGSVTSQQLAVQLQNRGMSVDRRKIEMDDIRTAGEHTATIKLHPEVSATLKIIVESESDDEAAEAK